jgi:hypothetical protein
MGYEPIKKRTAKFWRSRIVPSFTRIQDFESVRWFLRPRPRPLISSCHLTTSSAYQIFRFGEMKLPFGKVPARSILHNVVELTGMSRRTSCSFNIFRGLDSFGAGSCVSFCWPAADDMGTPCGFDWGPRCLVLGFLLNHGSLSLRGLLMGCLQRLLAESFARFH